MNLIVRRHLSKRKKLGLGDIKVAFKVIEPDLRPKR